MSNINYLICKNSQWIYIRIKLSLLFIMLTCIFDCAFVKAKLRLLKVVFQKLTSPLFINSHWIAVLLNSASILRLVVPTASTVKLVVNFDISFNALIAFRFASKTAFNTALFLSKTALSVSLMTWMGSTCWTAPTCLTAVSIRKI